MSAPRIVVEVVREHVELAAFQWAQRDTLAAEDLPDTDAIAFVDGRLAANLDALRIAGAAAWPFIIAAFETYPEKGELFVTAFHAIETRDAKRIEQAVCLARVADRGPRGLCGAFEWLPPRATRDLVREWVNSSDPIRCEAAIAALAAHRADPGEQLHRLLMHEGAGVRAAACRLAATLKRQDATPALREALGDPEAAVRDSGALALARLGHRDGEDRLKARVTAQEEGWEHVLRGLVAVTPDREMRSWLTDLNNVRKTKVIAVRAAGMLVDRSLAGWLVDQTKTPATAEAAGRALAELYPDMAANDDHWSMEAEVLGPDFVAHFGDEIPYLPVYSRLRARFQSVITVGRACE